MWKMDLFHDRAIFIHILANKLSLCLLSKKRKENLILYRTKSICVVVHISTLLI